MNDPQFINFKKEIKEHLEDIIQSKVNGKIDAMNIKLDAFIIRADPAVRVFENLTWLKKLLISFLIFLGVLAGAWTFISTFISKQ